MNDALGRHILCEAFECDPEVLNNVRGVENIMVEVALYAGAEVREVAFHKFSPQGVSGVVIISESHLAIHTWPEYGYAAIDIFTCGTKVDPGIACEYLLDKFNCSRSLINEVKRGIFEREEIKPGKEAI
jgi:S-adenosylmethionine decarboxylase